MPLPQPRGRWPGGPPPAGLWPKEPFHTQLRGPKGTSGKFPCPDPSTTNGEGPEGTSDQFSSYLSGRRQIVRGGDATLPVTCGVPQGSIIGPILFILFTSDLPAHLTHGCLISYADDTLHIDCASPEGPGLAELRARLELTMRELQGILRL